MLWAFGAFLVWFVLCLITGIIASRKERSGVSFWKIYGIVMAMDLLLYVLIFYVGRAIPPASPDTSFPGNYGLVIAWLIAHFPAALIFITTRVLPDSAMWLLIFQDAWVAGLIYWWRRRKSKPNNDTQSRAAADLG